MNLLYVDHSISRNFSTLFPSVFMVDLVKALKRRGDARVRERILAFKIL